MVSLLQSVDTSHEDMIHDAQMDFYGIRLATCSSDRSVRVFDVRGGTQKLVADLREHEGPVWQVAWAHPRFGTILGSCSYDRKVIIWKEVGGSWSKIYEYNNHDSSVNSLCWAPHEFGLMLACGSSDGAVSVISSTGDGTWDTKKINNAHTVHIHDPYREFSVEGGAESRDIIYAAILIGCNAVSFAPAIPAGSVFDQPGTQPQTLIKRFVTGGCDNLVKIWKYIEEEGTWKEDQKLEAHSDWVRDVAWAPSVGLPTSILASCSQDRRVIIWTNDGTNSAWTYQILHTFDDVVWHVSWSVTGNILAVSGGDNKVSLWKQTVDSQWVCISDVKKGEGVVTTAN